MAVDPTSPVFGVSDPDHMAAIVEVDVQRLNVNTPTKLTAKARVVYIAGQTSAQAAGGVAGAGVSEQPTSNATNAIVPSVASAASSKVIKAGPGNLYQASLVAGTTAGFMVGYNAVAVPAAAAALTPALVMFVIPVAAGGLADFKADIIPDRFTVGIVLIFTTDPTTNAVPATPAVHLRVKAV